MKPSRIQIQLEAAAALCAGLLGIVTIFWRDWIEILTGWDPDRHNGGAEWLIVALLLAVAVGMSAVAWRHRRALIATSSSQ